MNRRELLRAALACGATPSALSLLGCEGLIRVLGQSCPPDPAESGIVNWTPDVLHPVTFGFQNLGPAEGAPVPVRIWYPSHEVFTEGGPAPRSLLKLCLIRWPVVLFLHGMPPTLPPNNQRCSLTDYYLRWTRLPAVLAKSGYVVLVPQHAARLPSEPGSPEVVSMIRLIDWARGVPQIPSVMAKGAIDDVAVISNRWEHSQWVDKDSASVAVVGHSYGALLAARVAEARPGISSYVGLSGVFSELPTGAGALLQSFAAPKLFMWADKESFADLDATSVWSSVPTLKHAAIFDGAHFDYLRSWPECSFVPECPLIESAAADLTALFIARHTPVNLSQVNIPASLDPPAVMLTPSQQFFGADNLNGLRQFGSQADCRMTLRWETPGGSASRQLNA